MTEPPRSKDTPPTNPLHYLGPNSYTAQRLHHATPEHLHLTTRRCFIGPIPEGWLKSHRRDWYRNHLQKLYSSRAASFSAAANTVPQTTGLDDSGGSKIKQSFQQSKDLIDEHFREQDAEEQTNDSQAEASVNSPPAVTLPISEEDTTTVPARDTLNRDDRAKVEGIAASDSVESSFQGGGSREVPVEFPNDPSSIVRKVSLRGMYLPPASLKPKEGSSSSLTAVKSVQSTKTRKSSRSRMSKRTTSEVSFVTAAESLPGSPGSSNKGKDANLAPRIVMDGQLEAEPSEIRDSTVTIGSRPESTTALLKNHEQADVDPPRENTGSILKGIRKLSISRSKRVDISKDDSPVNATKPSIGAVRFNLPADNEQKDAMLKLRLVQHRRRDTLKQFRRGQQALGEIVKLEKMLVRVEFTTHELTAEFDENDSQKIESRTLDNWREYMVVCRESTTDDAECTIHMYKSRAIPATEKTHVAKRAAHEIVLTRKMTNINIFSSLDKTIVIWQPYKRGVQIFIMRPRSGASAMEWFTFLRGLLGWERSSELQVNVPDLSVTLRIDDPFENLESPENLRKAAEGDENALAKRIADEQASASNLVERCMVMLEKSPEWGTVIDEWAIPSSAKTHALQLSHMVTARADATPARGESVVSSSSASKTPEHKHHIHHLMGLAWKRYDRIEWIHGANEKSMYGTIGMEKSHELELRPKQHYPTSVHAGKETILAEPPPVEGFLVRLSSQEGKTQKAGKLFIKRLYFSTHNQYLVFNRPAQADPPPPPTLPMQENSQIPNAQQIQNKIPLIYAINPFPLHDNEIEWLSPESTLPPEEVIKNDELAYDENERKTNLLCKCDGIIDLTNVVKIRNVHRGATIADANISEGSDADFDGPVTDSTRDDGTTRNMDDERTFELLLKNNLVIRLQSYDQTTKREWMRRLKTLVEYWTLRTTADTHLYKAVRRQNLDALRIDEEMESLVGQFARKWEVSRSFASPELYHMCGISGCRTVQMAGNLYRKPRMHATFRSCHVVLSHGSLLVFQDAVRSRSGKLMAHIHHDRVTAIDLIECYIYSGLITSNDLSSGGGEGWEARKGHQGGLPRMYVQDGWSSTDEETMTCFVIWHGRRKGWSRSETMSGGGPGAKAKSKIRLVSQLGKEGTSIVFKTRSRAERDHWVLSIGMEIERLAATEEVRIVEK